MVVDREPMAEVAPGKGSMMSVVEQLLNYCRQGDLTQVGRMLSSSHVSYKLTYSTYIHTFMWI